MNTLETLRHIAAGIAAHDISNTTPKGEADEVILPTPSTPKQINNQQINAGNHEIDMFNFKRDSKKDTTAWSRALDFQTRYDLGHPCHYDDTFRSGMIQVAWRKWECGPTLLIQSYMDGRVFAVVSSQGGLASEDPFWVEDCSSDLADLDKIHDRWKEALEALKPDPPAPLRSMPNRNPETLKRINTSIKALYECDSWQHGEIHAKQLMAELCGNHNDDVIGGPLPYPRYMAIGRTLRNAVRFLLQRSDHPRHREMFDLLTDYFTDIESTAVNEIETLLEQCPDWSRPRPTT